ncbi:ChaN family lipoprotein [Roseobacter denitrificans]|nr:ChaN family lipoprotein [Roseobacter denitrificans]
MFLGEQHDNLTHHEVQASWVEQLSASALVFEMLTRAQASKITPDNRVDQATLGDVLDWQASGWPDFSMYYPIFAAAPEAPVFGAGVPRAQLREVMNGDVASLLGTDTAQRLGLDQPLPAAQQTVREALQRSAHCDALPEELLPKMVDVQRLRDAALAQAALQAYEQFGGPVIVITGNGHARADWGAPFILGQAAPDLSVFSLGKGEAGRMPDGSFTSVVDGPAVDRGSPCDAFAK